jgi:Flp pilus assembly protein TadB
MILPIGSSIIAGLGLWCLLQAVRPTTGNPFAVLATLDQPTPISAQGTDSAARRLGRRFIDSLTPTVGNLDTDLKVMGRTRPEHVLHRLRTMAFHAGTIVVIWAMPMLAGSRPLTSPLMLTTGVGAAAVFGWVATDQQLKRAATQRRTDFDNALVTWLGLVTILIAGGAGLQQALTDAANQGDGWAFQLLRRTLQTATLRSANPWDQLRDVGSEHDLQSLVDVSATMQLAGHAGAHVRQSLLTKARSLRHHQTATAERDANAKTTAMAGPTGLMVAGFVILLLYPALAAVASL